MNTTKNKGKFGKTEQYEIHDKRFLKFTKTVNYKTNNTDTKK